VPLQTSCNLRAGGRRARPVRFGPSTPEDADEARDLDEARRLHDVYAEVLLRPAETIRRMRALGAPQPAVGDAVVALPTLVHRGPGQEADGPPRRVLFFTLRPKFIGERAKDAAGTAYEPDKQIHASWLLWRTRSITDEATRHAVRTMYKKAGYDLAKWGDEGES
jgi:hypothetical protein